MSKKELKKIYKEIGSMEDQLCKINKALWENGEDDIGLVRIRIALIDAQTALEKLMGTSKSI